MNFYREWKRFYFGIQFGRRTAPIALSPIESVRADIERALLMGGMNRGLSGWVNAVKPDYSDGPRKTFAWGIDDPEANGIVHVGAQSAEVTVEPLNLPRADEGS